MVDGCLRDADFCCGFDPKQTMRWWVDASPTGEVTTWKESTWGPEITYSVLDCGRLRLCVACLFIGSDVPLRMLRPHITSI